MDLAPALPPSQDAVPVMVSEESTVQLSHLPSTTLSSTPSHIPSQNALQAAGISSNLGSVRQTSRLSRTFLPPALMVSIEGIEKASDATPAGFLSADSIAHSFNFVGQAWRAARFNNPLSKQLNQQLSQQLSATVPIQWASKDAWREKAIAADIQVRRVEVAPSEAQAENGVWSADLIEQCMPNASRELRPGVRYKISLGDRTLGYVADEKRAYTLAQQLKRLIRQASFSPESIAAYPVTDEALTQASDYSASTFVGTPGQRLFLVDETMAGSVGYSPEWAAVAWANNLRLALEVSPLKTGEILKGLNGLENSEITMSGEASWYGPYFHGKITANGETYNQNDLTVAHKSLPFGTQLEVRNVTNDRTVVLRVNDRGPYVGDRILDLSKAAADCLGSDGVGVVPVEATVLKTVK